MGKWKKLMKMHGDHHDFRMGPHGHNFPFGPHGHRFPFRPTDSDDESPIYFPKRGHHWAKWEAYRQAERARADEIANETVGCSLCSRAWKPFNEIEVLGCQHLYHKHCLKELINLSSVGDEDKTVSCTRCRKKIDDQLLEAFKNWLNIKHAANNNASANDGQTAARMES